MRRFALTILMMCCMGVGECSAMEVVKLEFKDVQNFSISESRKDGLLSLRLTGLAFHSSLAVERIEATTKNDTMIIKVLLVPARKGLSGHFDYTVDVPLGIRRVIFGEGGHQIWPTE